MKYHSPIKKELAICLIKKTALVKSSEDKTSWEYHNIDGEPNENGTTTKGIMTTGSMTRLSKADLSRAVVY